MEEIEILESDSYNTLQGKINARLNKGWVLKQMFVTSKTRGSERGFISEILYTALMYLPSD